MWEYETLQVKAPLEELKAIMDEWGKDRWEIFDVESWGEGISKYWLFLMKRQKNEVFS